MSDLILRGLAEVSDFFRLEQPTIVKRYFCVLHSIGISCRIATLFNEYCNEVIPSVIVLLPDK